MFIEANKGPYPFQRSPQFWSFLIEQAKAGSIRSPKMVYDELADYGDDLAKWITARKQDGFCINASREVQERYGVIAGWVVANYPAHQAAEFMDVADGWVIAHAMTPDGVVVTQESPKTKKAKVKIPTVCKALHVPWVSTYEMLNRLKAPF